MKNIPVFVVAALLFAVASSVQAVEANFVILSQSGDGQASVVKDAHSTLLDAEGNKVGEVFDNGTPMYDVLPGEYTVAVEVPANGLSGVKSVVIDENGVSVDDAIVIVLHSDAAAKGVDAYSQEVVGAPAMEPAPVVPNPVAAPIAAPVQPLPQVPVAAGFVGGAGGGIGSLAVLGAIGGMVATTIAVSTSDDERPVPVTPGNNYR